MADERTLRRRHEEVEIEDVRSGDVLLWEGRKKGVDVAGRPHYRERIDGEYVEVEISYQPTDEIEMVGPRGGHYFLRPKQRGEGYVVENGYRNYVEGPDAIFRV